MMELMEEAVEHGIIFGDTTPKIHCKAFEDNAGAIEIAKLPKMRPRTRHLNQALHFFRQHVKCYANGDQGKVEIIHVCLLYTSPSPRDGATSRMPSSA